MANNMNFTLMLLLLVVMVVMLSQYILMQPRDGYTEIYFVDYPKIASNEENTEFTFAVSNKESKNRKYNYLILFNNEIIKEDQIVVNSRTISEKTITLAINSDQKSKIGVRFPDIDQEIHFWTSVI